MTDASETAATTSGGERLLTTVGNLTRVSGFMGVKQKAYSLVITDRRIICAELSKERIKEMTNQARSAAKAEGKGVLGQIGAQMRAPSGYHERYRQMFPDDALAETPDNFAIDRGDIRKVKFSTGRVDDERNIPDTLTIKTGSGKHKFQVGGSLSTLKEAFRAAGLI